MIETLTAAMERASQVDSGSLPSGVTMPIPVTTTRRLPLSVASLIPSHPEPTVDEKHRARDEAGVLGGQEPYRSRHVLGVAEASQGRVLEHRLRRVVRQDRAVTDGPYIEAKDLVLGFIVVEARDLDEATDLAHGCPIVQGGGSIEIRPVIQL